MNTTRQVTKKDKFIRFGGPILLLIFLLGALELIVTVAEIPVYILPSSSVIITTFAQELTTTILPAAWSTLQVVLLGFIIGVPIGVIFAALMLQFRVLNKALSPYIIFLVCTPLISLVPILMLAMGYGMSVRILAVVLQVFPIVMMNSFTGFSNVQTIKLELMQSMGASRVATFFRVTLWDALPHVFTGIRLGTIFATTTAISTEVVSGNSGLGQLIMEAKGVLRTDLVLATIIMCAIIGILLYTTVQYIGKKAVKWKT